MDTKLLRFEWSTVHSLSNKQFHHTIINPKASATKLAKPEDETSEETCWPKCIAFHGKTDRRSSQVKQGSPYNMEPGQKMILQDDYN